MKTQLFCADNEDEVDQWIEAIQEAKTVAIKQRLGHMEIGEDDAYAQQAGEKMERVKMDHEERRRMNETHASPMGVPI